MQPRAADEHMFGEQRLGALLVARGHRVDDGFVFLRRHGDVVRAAADGRAAVQVELVDDATVLRQQRVVARGTRQQVVEFDVEREILVRALEILTPEVAALRRPRPRGPGPGRRRT